MKKILKLTLVLSIFAVLTISCSKIKTYGLVGTYKSEDGKLIMTVSQEGNASIGLANSNEDVTQLTATQRAFVKRLSTYQYDYSDRLESGNNFILEPWDLTAEKATQTFEVKIKAVSGMAEQTPGSGNYTPSAYEDVTYKAEFTKDKETYTCKLTISIPDNVKNINNKYRYTDYSTSGAQTTIKDKSAGYQIDNGGETTFTK